MAEDIPVEDYPTEIKEQLTGFESSVGGVNNMVQTILSMPRNELVQKLDPLEQAKLDLMSAYSLNSLFWMYLVTQGINPKEHAIKQELERIRTYMNRVKEITDRRKASRLNKPAMSRLLRNALWEPEEGKSKNTPGGDPQDTPGRAPQHTPGRGQRTPGRGHHTPGRGHRTPGRGHRTPGRGQHKRFDGHQSKGPKLS
ncbi:nuclear nucleic acid-binding protein C1D-like [Salvelinus fontinalis]|uniref:nuclear nucleic acid-binding protein C1D-like n=1 Tax=Salvelinus fontinalis TaxID=8038 RepID=UPI0024858544|nr:nuclear nucleic acid-binding protein C1D-like [Salvelinus fontinalis]